MVNSYYSIYQAERGKTAAETRAIDAQNGGLAAELGQFGSALVAQVRAARHRGYADVAEGIPVVGAHLLANREGAPRPGRRGITRGQQGHDDLQLQRHQQPGQPVHQLQP